MIKAIIQFSIQNKLFIGITVFFLLVAGIYSMLKLPIDAVPDITNNQVQIVTVAPSLAPQEVEKFITAPVEIAMANILNVQEIRSVSRFGLSVVTVVFKDKVPILDARQLVNEQIQIVAEELPEGYGKPQLMPITTGLGEIYQYTLGVKEGFEHQYSVTELRTIQDWIVKRQLSGIPGIVEISSFGGYLKQYEVAINTESLRSLDATIEEVFAALADNNQNSGGSYIEKYNNAYYIRTEGIVQNFEDIEEIVVKSQNGIPVKIKDIAQVKFGSATRFGAMTKNGKGECVGGITLMLKGANSSEVIKNVKERVEEVQKLLPQGVYLEPYLDRSKLVSKTISTVTRNLLEGGLIVIFVLVLLLGNFRAGIIVASVIPLSLLFAFIMMQLFGVSANLMSLGAIDFGIVIDGAVIIVESIIHHIFTFHKGTTLSKEEMDKVVLNSTSNIYKSAAFGVFIILIVFFPILTLTGIEGKMFVPMAKTVSFAIIGALLLSITYVPMVASLFLKRKVSAERTFSDRIIDFLKLSYTPILKFSLRLKYLLLSVTMVVLIISIWGFQHLGGEFIPNLEEGDLAMQMSLPPGSSLTESMEIAGRAEKTLIENFPEVKEVISKIGTAEVPTDPMAVEDADIMITMKEKDEWVSAESREEIVNKMKEKLNLVAGASFDFTQPIQLRFNELMTGAKTDIAIKIFGEDMDELFARANEAAGLISNIRGAADVKVEQISGLPQLVVKYNRQKISQYGLNIKDLNSIISSAYAGEKTGTVFEGEKKFDLVVRLNNANRHNFNLNQLFIRTSDGSQIPLSEVARVDFITGPMQISRENTQRRVIIGINVRNRDIESLITEIRTTLDTHLKLKPGYSISYGGQFQNLEAAKKRLSIAIPVALGLIMLLLFFTFNSLKYALMIFSAVPLSAIGGIAALAIRGMPFSISAGVGFIALFGVAVLNGIVLISYFNVLKEKGLPLNDVVMEGALTRLRPVMMTALVASLGFLPMALSTSAGAEVQKPLATVVISGLVTSTMLTMIILPILYTIFNTPRRRTRKVPVSKALFLTVMLSLPFFSKAQENNAKVITLDNAVTMALSNHPSSKNAALKVEAARSVKSVYLDPTEIVWEHGQINSTLQDNSVLISQNFGSPLTHIQRNRYYKNQLELAETSQKITQKQLIASVKEAYFMWVFQYAMNNLIEEETQLFEEFLRISQLHFELGESDLLEKTMAETRYDESQRKLLTAREQLKIVTNKLNRFIYSEEQYAPPQEELDLYSIQFPKDQTDKFYPYTFKDYFQQQVKQKNIELEVEKSYLFPAISAGYFNQSINPAKNLQGFQIGLSVPLWFFPRTAKIKEARINRDIAINESTLKTYELEQTIDDLKIRLDQEFINVVYYRESALQQADLLIKTATLKLQKEEIEYTEYLQSISEAIKIKSDYLRTVLNYNITAVELEYYLN